MKVNEKTIYNEEPVFFCKKCLSLKVKTVGDLDYCDKCGCTEIDKAHLTYWNKLYKEKYGKFFIEE